MVSAMSELLNIDKLYRDLYNKSVGNIEVPDGYRLEIIDVKFRVEDKDFKHNTFTCDIYYKLISKLKLKYMTTKKYEELISYVKTETDIEKIKSMLIEIIDNEDSEDLYENWVGSGIEEEDDDNEIEEDYED